MTYHNFTELFCKTHITENDLKKMRGDIKNVFDE